MRLKSRDSLILMVFLAGFASFLGFDILADLNNGMHLSHLIIDICMVSGLFLGVLALWYSRMRMSEQIKVISGNLQETQKLYELEKKALSEGLLVAMEKKFQEWHFSPSEKEIATLLLKGLSLKEIADLRNTSERTVRQQAQSLYAKSNLHGRAELSAYFLEDIL